MDRDRRGLVRDTRPFVAGRWSRRSFPNGDRRRRYRVSSSSLPAAAADRQDPPTRASAGGPPPRGHPVPARLAARLPPFLRPDVGAVPPEDVSRSRKPRIRDTPRAGILPLLRLESTSPPRLLQLQPWRLASHRVELPSQDRTAGPVASQGSPARPPPLRARVLAHAEVVVGARARREHGGCPLVEGPVPTGGGRRAERSRAPLRAVRKALTTWKDAGERSSAVRRRDGRILLVRLQGFGSRLAASDRRSRRTLTAARRVAVWVAVHQDGRRGWGPREDHLSSLTSSR